MNYDSVVLQRNKNWANNPKIPAWVNCESVGLDRYFTRPEIADECYKSMLSCMKSDRAFKTD